MKGRKKGRGDVEHLGGTAPRISDLNGGKKKPRH